MLPIATFSGSAALLTLGHVQAYLYTDNGQGREKARLDGGAGVRQSKDMAGIRAWV